MNITFCGVNVTTVPDQFKRVQPQGRFNYIDIPWNASCPSHGMLLVTANQLNGIIEAGGYGDLVLEVTGDGESPDTVNEDQSVTLKNIYCVKALPIFGEYYQPAPDEHEGLYALEIQDIRSVLLMRVPSNTSINYQLPPFDGTNFVAYSTSGGSPYTLQDIFTILAFGQGIDLSAPAPFDTMIPCDMDLRGIPLPVALDLIVSGMCINQVIKMDPSDESEPTKMALCSLDASVDLVMNTYMKYRLFGGKGVLFNPANRAGSYRIIPEHTYAVPDMSQDLNTRTAYPLPPENTVDFGSGVTINFVGITGVYQGTPPADISALRKVAANRSRNPVRNIYRGFIKDFLSVEYPFSLVTFDWSELPTTHVHLANTTPIRTLLEGPNWRFVKDLPTRVQYNGNLQPTTQPGSFLVKITKCAPQGYAEANILTGDPGGVLSPTTETIPVFVGLESWWRVGDEVWVVPGAMKNARWVAVCGRYGPYFWKPIQSGEEAPGQDEPDPDDYCTDTVTPEST